MKRALTLAALFALVLTLGWAQANRPRSAAQPVVFSVSGDTQVEAAGVTVRLVQVAQVERLISDSYETDGEVLPTEGTWVAAEIEVGSTHKTIGSVAFALVDRFGRSFIVTTRAGDSGYILQPGEQVTVQVAFEVPLDALPASAADGGDPGLTLRVYPEGIDYYTVGIPMELADIRISEIETVTEVRLNEVVGPEMAS